MKLSSTFVTLSILFSAAFAMPFKTRDDHCDGCDPIVHATTETSIYSCRLAGVLSGDPRTTLEAFEKGLIQPPERIYPALFRQLLQQCCDAVNPEHTDTDLPSDVNIEYNTPTTISHTVDDALNAEDLDMAGAGPDNSILDPAIKLVMPGETPTSGAPASTPTSDAPSTSPMSTSAVSGTSTSADATPLSTAAVTTQDNSESTPNAAPTPTDSSSNNSSASPSSTSNATSPNSNAPSTSASPSPSQGAAATADSPTSTDASPAPSSAAVTSSSAEPTPASDDGEDGTPFTLAEIPMPTSASPDCRFSNTDGSDVYAEVCESASVSLAASATSAFSATATPTSTPAGCRLSHDDEGDVWIEVCESMTASASGSVPLSSAKPTGLVLSPQ